MRFTTHSKALSKALDSVSRAIKSKTSLPILGCVLFERDPDDERLLQLTGTDLHVMSIVTRIAVDFKEPSSSVKRVAIPSRYLTRITKTLGDVPVTFEFGEHYTLKIRTDQGEYSLSGYDGGDFPAVPDVIPDATAEVATDLLNRASEVGSIALSTEEARPSMTGYLFQLRKDELRIVTTDSHRLVRTRLPMVKCSKDSNVVVPGMGFRALRFLSGSDTCRLGIGSDHAVFDIGASVLTTTLIDAKFPNYQRVLGRMTTPREVVIHRPEFLSAVTRTKVFSSGGSTGLGQIRLEIQSDRMKVSAEDIERAHSAYEEVKCSFKTLDSKGNATAAREKFVIAFNAAYLEGVLQQLSGEVAVMKMNEPKHACSICPQDAPSEFSLFTLIMPVMLGQY